MCVLCINKMLYMYTEYLVSSPSPSTANNVKMCQYLHTCSLSCNCFGDDGLKALAEGIKNYKELKQLK